MNTCSCSSIIRASGLFDILLMVPFAIPGLASWVLTEIAIVHEALSLTGAVPVFSPFHLLFVNLMAGITIVWSVLRVSDPKPIYGVYDSVARIIVATLMLIYLLYYDVTAVLWLFFTVELCWALIQISGFLFKYKNDPVYKIKLA